MPNAIYYQILQAVQTSCHTVVTNTAIRWTPKLLETDTLPICFVCPEGETIKENTYANVSSGGKAGVWYWYPVLIAYIAAGNQAAAAGLVTFMNTRESLRNQLYQMNAGSVLTGVSSVFDLDLNPEAVQRLAVQLGTNYVVTGFSVRYTSAETRLS